MQHFSTILSPHCVFREKTKNQFIFRENRQRLFLWQRATANINTAIKICLEATINNYTAVFDCAKPCNLIYAVYPFHYTV